MSRNWVLTKVSCFSTPHPPFFILLSDPGAESPETTISLANQPSIGFHQWEAPVANWKVGVRKVLFFHLLGASGNG